jgi:hypothetical protein
LPEDYTVFSTSGGGGIDTFTAQTATTLKELLDTISGNKEIKLTFDILGLTDDAKRMVLLVSDAMTYAGESGVISLLTAFQMELNTTQDAKTALDVVSMMLQVPGYSKFIGTFLAGLNFDLTSGSTQFTSDQIAKLISGVSPAVVQEVLVKLGFDSSEATAQIDKFMAELASKFGYTLGVSTGTSTGTGGEATAVTNQPGGNVNLPQITETTMAFGFTPISSLGVTPEDIYYGAHAKGSAAAIKAWRYSYNPPIGLADLVAWYNAAASALGTDTISLMSAYTQGFAQGGISSGPDSGYSALLHGTELIVPMNNGIPGKASIADNSDVVAELKQIKAFIRQVAVYTNEMAKPKDLKIDYNSGMARMVASYNKKDPYIIRKENSY